MSPDTAEEIRLLEAKLLHSLSPAEEAKLPADLLNQASENIRAKIREGLDAARRGDFVDGEEFFARWRKRIEAASQKPK